MARAPTESALRPMHAPHQGRHVQMLLEPESLKALLDALDHFVRRSRDAEVPERHKSVRGIEGLLQLVGIHKGADPLRLQLGHDSAFARPIRACEHTQARLCGLHGSRGRLSSASGFT